MTARVGPSVGAAFDLGDKTLMKALEGGFKAVFLPAVRSASLEWRTKSLLTKHPERTADDVFAGLDVKQLDRGRPRALLPAMGAVEGSMASLAITGLTVSSSVSGGVTAAGAISAVATDVIATLALLGRAVADVAVHCGYDPREPEEELFLMGVLNYSTASSGAGKAAALARLSRLSQQMMRHATWDQLGKEAIVRAIRSVFEKLGLKLTHKRLATVVPILGVAVAGTLSFATLSSAIEDATRIYRKRYLAEK